MKEENKHLRSQPLNLDKVEVKAFIDILKSNKDEFSSIEDKEYRELAHSYTNQVINRMEKINGLKNNQFQSIVTDILVDESYKITELPNPNILNNIEALNRKLKKATDPKDKEYFEQLIDKRTKEDYAIEILQVKRLATYRKAVGKIAKFSGNSSTELEFSRHGIFERESTDIMGLLQDSKFQESNLKSMHINVNGIETEAANHSIDLLVRPGIKIELLEHLKEKFQGQLEEYVDQSRSLGGLNL